MPNVGSTTVNQSFSTVLTIYDMSDLDEKEIRISLKLAEGSTSFTREEVWYLLWKIESLRDKITLLEKKAAADDVESV